MSLNLSKGEKVDLTKGHADLKKLGFGCGWDLKPGSPAFDLDATVVCLGANGKRVDPDMMKSTCYFKNLTGVAGIVHSGDNRTGAGDGDDETITMTLDSLPAGTEKIALLLNIYEAGATQRFGQVANAVVRAYNSETQEEYFKYDVSEEGGTNTGLIMGYAYKHGAEWKFEAASEFVNGSINDIIDAKGW